METSNVLTDKSFEAFTNMQIEETEAFFNATETKPEFWYQWGNEPTGMVSTGAYVNDVYKFTGYCQLAVKQTLPFHNPHN